MPSRTPFTRGAMLSSSLGLILAGCGGVREVQAISPDERGLKELGQVYRDFATKKKRGPKNLKELNIKGQHYPIAVEMIKSVDLIVQWGPRCLPRAKLPIPSSPTSRPCPNRGVTSSCRMAGRSRR